MTRIETINECIQRVQECLDEAKRNDESVVITGCTERLCELRAERRRTLYAPRPRSSGD